VHIVAKRIKGHEYFYLVEKARQDGRVVTARTVYIGDRQKLAQLVQQSASATLPQSFVAQEVGASLALATVASDLGVEAVIDTICPVRQGAAPLGRRVLLAALHRALAARGENSQRSLPEFYDSSVLAELLPIPVTDLDSRRMGEALGGVTSKQVEQIESAIVRRLIETEGISLNALAFDCTNFDSYAGAATASRLLQRGHAKSGRPLRVMGLGLLVTEDGGMPLLTFAYPGNENDVTSFARFLKALDRRRGALALPLDTTIAADGGNISRQLLLRLEADPRYYVLRLPAHHLVDVPRCPSDELPPLRGRLKGKVWARKYVCAVYGVERCVVDVYSRRMHKRQLPGLCRDRAHARAELCNLARLLENQRQGKRRAAPLTVREVKRRVDKAVAREHMASVFAVRVAPSEQAPTLEFHEVPQAWEHLQEHVLGRTLLVTNRRDWTPEQIVNASRKQSHNERFFRDLKDPGGVSMLPLRHRRDAALRVHALVVVLGLMLAKVLERRMRRAALPAASIAAVLTPLKKVQRARLHFGPNAPPALRALASRVWVPSERSPQQQAMLDVLGLSNRPELGTTLENALTRSRRGRQRKTAA